MKESYTTMRTLVLTCALAVAFASSLMAQSAGGPAGGGERPTATPTETPDPSDLPFPTEWPYPTPTNIPVPEPPPGFQVVAFSGLVKAVSLDPPAMTVNRHEVAITTQTVMVGPSGAIGLEEFAVGERVAVWGLRERGGGGPGDEAGDPSAITALFIAKIAPPEPKWQRTGPQRVSGRVHAIDPEQRSFIVHLKEVCVLTDDETVFVDHWTTGLSFDDVTTGCVVTARGEWITTRTLFDADWVRINLPRRQRDARTSEPLSVETGFLMEKRAEDEWRLNTGQAVTLTSLTRFFTFPHTEATDEDIEVGDFLRVVGAREAAVAEEEGEAIVAARVHARPALVELVSTETLSFEANGLTVLTSVDTAIMDRDGDPLAFEDISVGDLTRLRGTFVTTDSLDSSAVTVLCGAQPSTRVADFNPIEGQRRDGGGWDLTCTTNSRAFGYIDFPGDAIPAADGMIYRVAATVASNVENPSKSPRLRLRFMSQNLQKVQILSVTNTGDARYSPTTAGVRYEHVIVPPPVDPEADEGANDMYLAFDMINMDDRNQANARFTLLDMAVEAVAAENVAVLETLVNDDFEDGADGWEFHASPGVFTSPVGRQTSGGLGLQPRDAQSFGFWTRLAADVALTPGELYRARLLVQANAPELEDVPGFRARLSNSGLQLASITRLNSLGDAETMPDADGVAIDTYLVFPGVAPEGEFPIMAFDLVNFDGTDALDVEIVLDEAILERIELNP